MWWRGFRFCVSIKLQDDETLLLREALEHNGGFACIDGVGSSPVVLRWVRAGATTYLLNAVGILKFLRLRVELSLS